MLPLRTAEYSADGHLSSSLVLAHANPRDYDPSPCVDLAEFQIPLTDISASTRYSGAARRAAASGGQVRGFQNIEMEVYLRSFSVLPEARDVPSLQTPYNSDPSLFRAALLLAGTEIPESRCLLRVLGHRPCQACGILYRDLLRPGVARKA